jgi:hypothetical protein
MSYTNPNVQQRFLKFREWSWRRQSEGRPFVPSTDSAAFEKMDPIAAKHGGETALSAWDRAAAELGITLKQPASIPQPIPVDFQAQIDRMSSTQLRERLSKDKTFSDLYGRFASGEKPEGQVAAANEYGSFQAKDWRALPAHTLARLMLKEPFRKRIDQLVAEGSI